MVEKLSVPNPKDIRDAILRVDRSGLIVRGIPNPNVTFGSDYYLRAESVAQQLAILYANQQVLAEQTMPDSAEGTDLQRILDIFGLSPREAQPSSGPVILESSAACTILTTQQLIDDQGQTYAVTLGGSYNDGDEIPIQAISTGKGTNHPQGTLLQWVSPPAFASATTLVGIGGLIGGADTDTDETSRDRLFTYFRNPPQAGNWSQVAGWATSASASVWAAYVYPALNGPATVGVCVLGPLGFDATNGFTREISTPTLNLVIGYLAARVPEGINVLVTTPTDTGISTGPCIDCDVAIGVQLPVAITGGGLGGGWVDAVPWPNLLVDGTYAYAETVTSTTDITITSNDPANCPTSTDIVVGDTTICWFSPTAWANGDDPVIVATVTAVTTTTTGHVRVSLSTPFPEVEIGDYIFPNSENVQLYVTAWMAAMENMGPGEWTDHPQVIIRAARRPRTAASNPFNLSGVQLRSITDVGEEVLDIDYLHSNVDTPGVPTDTTVSSPLILVPRRFGIFDKIP
jgi:uncharacterized phage protein gp47/JayE